MTERPILFSAPMVRAILDGSKTQTRRVMKPQPVESLPVSKPMVGEMNAVWHEPGGWRWGNHYAAGSLDNLLELLRDGLRSPSLAAHFPFFTGDRLWVRETWAPCAAEGPPYYAADYSDVRQELGVTGWRWRPSIHMPRWASRITLEVTSIRVERLQDISEEDARAEGVTPLVGIADEQVIPGPGFSGARLGDQPHRLPFAFLWESIYGADSWDANPWVWVIEFKRVEVTP